jgi:PAS domain S-box-containing protein
VTTFLGEMALILSQLGYARLAVAEEAELLQREIATRRQAEEALATERERLLVTLRSIGDGVITTDTQGQIVLMNKVAEDLTGWSLAESIDRPLSDVFHIINEQTRAQCANPVEKVLSSGQIVGLANHTVLVCRDGTERLVADSGAPIRDHSGTIIGVVLVFRDVTARHKAETALQNAQKLQSLGVLAGGIAHDFNNYLGGILGHVDLALYSAQSGNSSEAADELSQVARVVDKARNLTQRLLTFARGEAPVLKPGSITEVVREIAAFSTSGSNVALEFHAHPDLPPCSFDSDQIAQVIQNLVLNAIEAMPGGGVVRVALEPATLRQSHSVPAGSYVKVAVRDHGDGIPPNIMPHIFDPFLTTKGAGSGLGLSICYSIVKKHGGYIEASSRAGEGSEFAVLLPAVESGQALAEPPKPQPMHRGHGAAIVMDDEDFIRVVTSSMLQRMGYDTATASDGAEVLRLLDEKPFQLVMLDLTVPGGMGGVKAVREIRQRFPTGMTILAMSGYSDAQGLTNPKACGFDNSIVKPFTMSDLSALLNATVARTHEAQD